MIDKRLIRDHTIHGHWTWFASVGEVRKKPVEMMTTLEGNTWHIDALGEIRGWNSKKKCYSPACWGATKESTSQQPFWRVIHSWRWVDKRGKELPQIQRAELERQICAHCRVRRVRKVVRHPKTNKWVRQRWIYPEDGTLILQPNGGNRWRYPDEQG